MIGWSKKTIGHVVAPLFRQHSGADIYELDEDEIDKAFELMLVTETAQWS